MAASRMNPRLLLVAALLLLTACGQQAAPAAQPPKPSAAGTPVPRPSLVPTALVASEGGSPTLPPPGPVLYKGIPASRQPDGFFVLGRPEAPALTDYSDFL